MGKVIFSINISLDGYADHTVAIADDELHDFFTEQLHNIDISVFGQKTYQLMESYWPVAHQDPNATKSILSFAQRFNSMAKMVFSGTLQEAKWNNTKLVKRDVVEVISEMKRQTDYVMSIGGISIAQTLTRHNLIDEFWILVHPVIVGTGRFLFENLSKPAKLKLADTKIFRSGVVVLHYLCDS